MLVKVLLFTELSPYIRSSFYEEISSSSQNDTFDRLFYQLLDLRHTLDMEVALGLRITPLRKIGDLERLHWEIIAWLRRYEGISRYKHLSFVPPPFKGFEGVNRQGQMIRIVPLESGQALREEGLLMHHCIASFAPRIYSDKGQSYVYHLEAEYGERVTLF